MTSLRRARLHMRAADALLELGDPDEVAELVAEHLWAAVPLGVGVRAADALERAAEVAVRRAAFTTAEDLLQRALTLRRSAGSSLEHLGAELGTLNSLAGVARSLHGYIAILDLVDRGKELATRLGERDLLTNLEWAEWAAADTACDFARAEPIAERFRAMAEEAGPDDLVSLTLGHSVWGIQCWHMGRIGEAAAALDASREAARRLPVDEVLFGIVAEQRLLSETFTVHVHDLVGDLDDPGAHYAVLVRSLDDRFARSMIAVFESAAASSIGDAERAVAASRAGLAADPDVAFSFWGSMNQMYLAAAELATGADVDEAVARFEDGHARFRRAGTRTGLGLFYSSMARALTSVGELDRAADYLRTAQDELRTYGERWPEPVILLAEAQLLARTGGAASEVGALLARAEAVATEQGSHAIARRVAAVAAGASADAGVTQVGASEAGEA
jgi:tetratricopeptide (TPR) repeat protein